MMMMQFPTIIWITLFFALNIFVSIKYHEKPTDFESYGIGNRSFGWIFFSFTYIGFWAVGSIYISWFNSAAKTGIFAQYLLIYSMFSLVILYFMARPVWIWGKTFSLCTQADLIELRYGSKLFKQFFSLLTFILWIPWLILEMKTVGYSISIATDFLIDANLGMAVVCLFVIIYTYYGGIRGSAIACIVQVTVFCGIGIIVTGLLIHKIYGSIFNIYNVIEKCAPELLTLQLNSDEPSWTSVIITSTLGAFCLPGMFRLLYVADSHRTIRKSILIVPLVFTPAMLLLLLLGLGGISLPNFQPGYDPLLFWVAKSYGGNIMLGMVAIFALTASMSTMSGVIGASSIIISKDWIGSIAKSASDNELLRYSKAATIWVGIISLYIAAIDIPDLLSIVQLMYDCIVQAFIPLFFGLYWKRSNLIGAGSGMITGIIIAIYGNINPSSIIWSNGWSSGVVGLAFNMLIHLLAGFIWGKQAHVEGLFMYLKK